MLYSGIKSTHLKVCVSYYEIFVLVDVHYINIIFVVALIYLNYLLLLLRDFKGFLNIYYFTY